MTITRFKRADGIVCVEGPTFIEDQEVGDSLCGRPWLDALTTSEAITCERCLVIIDWCRCRAMEETIKIPTLVKR